MKVNKNISLIFGLTIGLVIGLAIPMIILSFDKTETKKECLQRMYLDEIDNTIYYLDKKNSMFDYTKELYSDSLDMSIYCKRVILIELVKELEK
jgi:uncharacterized membrane-anchored protein YhcB (DUF1043 family)